MTTGSLEGITPLDTIAYGYTAEDWLGSSATSCDGQTIHERLHRQYAERRNVVSMLGSTAVSLRR